jgi:nucleoid DNA-binding protein
MADKAKSINKSQLLQDVAAGTGLNRKQVAAVFEELGKVLRRELGKKGPGIVNVMGLFKIQRIVKPATKATQRPNPFKPGEMMTVKAKPARSIIKVRPLKELKAMV